MWTDWLGYLLVVMLAMQLVGKRSRAALRMAVLLLIVAFISGLAFMLQIHLAMPGAWEELYQAFRERSGHGDLSGGTFTASQWLRTEYTDLTSLFNPLAWILAAAGAIIAVTGRDRLTVREASLLHIGAMLFLMDAIYVCLLRNQSYIHDFAGFYFLAPVAIYSGFLIEWLLRKVGFRWSGVLSVAACLLAAGLIWWGVRSLETIDTQFCILDDDDTEPAMLMPDVGRLIDRSFAADAVVICNFDQYYSPLPYYARRVMTNNMHEYADWERSVSDALPQPAGGIVWTGARDAAELIKHLPSTETRPVTVDGIPFLLWLPPNAAGH
jgi:hypothetical protein